MRSVEPLTVEAATSDPRVQTLSSRDAFHIGSYLGVPVVLEDGNLFGTLCVVDPDAHRFDADDLDLLAIISAWLRMVLAPESLPGRLGTNAE